MEKIFNSKMICGRSFINRFRIDKNKVNSIRYSISWDGIEWEEECSILSDIKHPMKLDMVNIEDLGTYHEILVVVLSKHNGISTVTLATSIGGNIWFSQKLLDSVELGVDEIKKLRIVRNVDFINIYISCIKNGKKIAYVIQIKDHVLKEALERREYKDHLKVSYEIYPLE